MKDLLLTKFDLQGQLVNYGSVGGAKDENFSRSTIVPLSNTFMLAWESQSFATNTASMLVEFAPLLSTGCQVNRGTLLRTTLNLGTTTITPSAVYNKLKIKSQQTTAQTFTIDSIYLVCGSTPTTVQEPDGSSSFRCYTLGNQIKIESNDTVRFRVFDLNGKLIANGDRMATSHETTLKEQVSGLSIVVVEDAIGNTNHQKLLVSLH